MTVLPLESVREQVASGVLVVRPLEGMDAVLPIAVAARSREMLTAPARALIGLLLERAESVSEVADRSH
jgi:DNA-binding transcriptional LysR family regulator